MRIGKKLNENQNLLIYHSFILSNFSYCPVIWMFCGKVCNNAINRVQRKALRIIYNDYISSFDDLLTRG